MLDDEEYRLIEEARHKGMSVVERERLLRGVIATPPSFQPRLSQTTFVLSLKCIGP
jgi:hypothetical protein